MKETYCERLKGNTSFQSGAKIKITYDFTSTEYTELLEKYNLGQMQAANDFDTCTNLLAWVNGNIAHRGDYDNSDIQDALTLLDKAYQTDYGINCLAMSIVLCECLLAVGTRARVVYMMPEAADDGDNHVVVEAFISEWKKWIMLDPTYGAYCVNQEGLVLNLLELRNIMIAGIDYSFSDSLNYNGDTDLDLEDIKSYYAKNLFFFRCKSQQGYGSHRAYGNMLEIAPTGFSVHQRMVDNLHYRIDTYGAFDLFVTWLEYERTLDNIYIDLECFYE